MVRMSYCANLATDLVMHYSSCQWEEASRALWPHLTAENFAYFVEKVIGHHFNGVKPAPGPVLNSQRSSIKVTRNRTHLLAIGNGIVAVVFSPLKRSSLQRV